MATFVLVPGFWLGAWAWRAVTDDLRGRGHDVYPLSLTGLGERVHLARPDIDLDTHVTDVVNLLRYEDLRNVVLVGHSYGGLVVTAAADREPSRVSRLVYVDTGPLPDGVAQVEFSPPEEQQRPRPRSTSTATAGGCRRHLGRSLRQRHPMWTMPRSLCWPSAVSISRTRPRPRRCGSPAPGSRSPGWVCCRASPSRKQSRWRRRCRLLRHMAGERWRFVELPTWHWPMLNRPAELASILDEAAP